MANGGSITPSAPTIGASTSQALVAAGVSSPKWYKYASLSGDSLTGVSGNNATYNAGPALGVAKVRAEEEIQESTGGTVTSNADNSQSGISGGSVVMLPRFDTVGGYIEYEVPSGGFDPTTVIGLIESSSAQQWKVGGDGQCYVAATPEGSPITFAPGDKLRFTIDTGRVIKLSVNGTLAHTFGTAGIGSGFYFRARIIFGANETFKRPEMSQDFTNWNYGESVITVIAPDVTAPSLVSIAIPNSNRNRIDMTYDEALDTGSVPVAGDFALASAGGRTITALAIVGSVLRLTVSSVFHVGDAPTISYTPGSNPIQDAAGNQSSSLTNHAITNNIAPPANVAGLSATKIDDTSVAIDSSVASGAATYRTERRINGGSFIVLTPTTKAFTDTEDFPVPPGAYTFEYRRKAVDSDGNLSAAYSSTTAPITINIVITIVVAPTTIPEGTVSEPYIQGEAFSASGGTSPYALVQTGTLPTGMSYNATTKKIEGTPAEDADGTYPITITATDADDNVGHRDYNLVINPTDPGDGKGVRWTAPLIIGGLPTGLLDSGVLILDTQSDALQVPDGKVLLARMAVGSDAPSFITRSIATYIPPVPSIDGFYDVGLFVRIGTHVFGVGILGSLFNNEVSGGGDGDVDGGDL